MTFDGLFYRDYLQNYFRKTAGAATAFAWGYHHQGAKGLVEPSRWLDHFSGCGGHQQSPINIIKAASIGSRLPPLALSGYGKGIFPIKNNGRTVQVNFPTMGGQMVQRNATSSLVSSSRTTSTSDNVYKLEQLHFHWSSYDELGSEHAVNGMKFGRDASCSL